MTGQVATPSGSRKREALTAFGVLRSIDAWAWVSISLLPTAQKVSLQL